MAWDDDRKGSWVGRAYGGGDEDLFVGKGRGGENDGALAAEGREDVSELRQSLGDGG